LAGLAFESADELLDAVQGLLEDVEKGTLQAVFLERMDRLGNRVAANGEYTN
jgi:hypothetical protein